MSQALPESLRRKVPWLIWGALILAIIVYIGIGSKGEATASNREVTFVFIAITFLSIALAQLVRTFFITRPLKAGTLDPTTDDGWRKLLVFSLVVWTLIESVAVYGLLLRFTGADMRTFLNFAGASLLLMLYHTPTWFRGGKAGF